MKKILLLFFVLIFKSTMVGQSTQPNDCVDAITVCGNGTLISNAKGYGDKYEVTDCVGAEHNSLWLKVNIVQAGNLGFDLIPNDPKISADFDFWVYKANNGCPTTVDNAIRCCTTNPIEAGLTSNHTGIDGSTLVTTAWSGTNGNGLPYVQWLK